MKRWLMLLGLLAPNLTGCMPYVYPTVSHTPELTVPNADGSVHAFRVDVDRTERAPEATTTQYTLWRIPIDERGIIPSQLEIAPATGIYNPLGITDTPAHERSQYSMCVRLYRPGYRTQEVQQWGKARDLQWAPASDLLAQEKAVDDLLAVPTATPGGSWWELKDQKQPALGLQPGIDSNYHKQALLFASSEYQRLAAGPLAAQPANQTVRERLQQKAIWLRRYAEQSQ
jgi:hypothetical protein